MNFEVEKDPKKIAAMFSSIAPKYDFLNSFLSLGMSDKWKSVLIKQADLPKRCLILDICTGSGDLALGFLTERKDFKGYVFAIDFSVPMIDRARTRLAELGAPYPRRVEFLMGDALDLNFRDDKFDCISNAFGIRNYANARLGLEEIHRVLKPGGQVSILEFFKDGITVPPVKWAIDGVVPLVGNIVSGTKAYTYLRNSSNEFYTLNEFSDLMKDIGFIKINMEPMTLGIAHLVTARKDVIT